MISKLAGLAVALAVGALAAMPASAQKKGYNDLTQTELDELFCVYDGIGMSDDFYDIGDVSISGIDIVGDYEDAADMAEPYVKACSSKYQWDDEKLDIAMMVGITGTASDVLMEDLLDRGFKDGDLDIVLDALATLEEEELDALNDASYRTNQTMKEHMLAEVKAAGALVGKDFADDILLLMELNVMGFYASADWVDYVFN